MWQQERGWVWGDKDWRHKELFAAVIQLNGVGLIGGGRLQGEEEESSQKRHWGGRVGTPCCLERVGETEVSPRMTPRHMVSGQLAHMEYRGERAFVSCCFNNRTVF